MRSGCGSILLAMTFCLTFCPAATAENWPGWRGPRGDGTSLEANVPRKWEGQSGKNIAWKRAIPGEGHGSPIVWEDHVFVVSCLPENHERVLICLNRQDGSVRWQQSVITAPLETKHSLNSYASCTPATDGQRVYVAFLEVDGSTIPAPNVGSKREVTPGQIAVAAYDLAGRQKWLVRPGGFVSAHGFCSNPVLHGDLVIINGDHDGDSYIAALHKSTGEIIWKTPRKHQTRSYVTPLIRDIEGRTQMVLSGSKRVVSLDPRDGSTHWTIEGPTEQFVASMVYDGQRFFMAAGFPTYHVLAIEPGGSGDVTSTHVAWRSTEAKCYVPSPVVVGKYLLVADDRGTGNCFDTATGKRLWQERLGTHFSGSLVTAGGLVYFTGDDGVTNIVQPAAELKIVESNALGEHCYSSPAISSQQIFVRGEKHLYCIGQSKP